MIPYPEITLRKTILPDLEFFFLFQLDEEANYLAAFTPKDPTDKAAYLREIQQTGERPGYQYADHIGW